MGGTAWIDLTQNRDRWRAHVHVCNAKNFLTSWGPVSYSRSTLLHGVSWSYNDLPGTDKQMITMLLFRKLSTWVLWGENRADCYKIRNCNFPLVMCRTSTPMVGAVRNTLADGSGLLLSDYAAFHNIYFPSVDPYRITKYTWIWK